MKIYFSKYFNCILVKDWLPLFIINFVLSKLDKLICSFAINDKQWIFSRILSIRYFEEKLILLKSSKLFNCMIPALFSYFFNCSWLRPFLFFVFFFLNLKGIIGLNRLDFSVLWAKALRTSLGWKSLNLLFLLFYYLNLIFWTSSLLRTYRQKKLGIA